MFFNKNSSSYIWIKSNFETMTPYRKTNQYTYVDNIYKYRFLSSASCSRTILSAAFIVAGVTAALMMYWDVWFAQRSSPLWEKFESAAATVGDFDSLVAIFTNGMNISLSSLYGKFGYSRSIYLTFFQVRIEFCGYFFISKVVSIFGFFFVSFRTFSL